jgi:hypothetical protein
MENIFAFLLIVASSASAYAIGRRTSPASGRSIREAIETMLECVGASAVFLVFNIVFGAAIILLIRTFTTRFLSLYQLGDLMVPILSIVQGFVFQLWWRGIAPKRAQP